MNLLWLIAEYIFRGFCGKVGFLRGRIIPAECIFPRFFAEKLSIIGAVANIESLAYIGE